MPLKASLLRQFKAPSSTSYGDSQAVGDSFFVQSEPTQPGTILVYDSDEPFLKMTAGKCEEMGIPLHRCQAKEQLRRTLAKTNPDCIWLAGNSLAIEQALPLCVSKSTNESTLVLLLDPGQEIIVKFPLPTKDPLSVIEKPRQSEKIRALLERTLVAQQQRRVAEQYLTFYDDQINRLLPPEREVLLAICNGTLNKQMAKQLSVSIRTIEQKRQRLFRLLGVRSAGPLGYRAGLTEACRKMVQHRRWPLDVE